MADTVVKIKGEWKAETDRAMCLLVKTVDGYPPETEKREWFPISQCHKIFRPSVKEAHDGALHELHVSQWIAQQKGLV